MRENLTNCSVDLDKNQPLRLDGAFGTIIHCVRGIAWLTISGHGEDIFLMPGQSYHLNSHALAIIEAIDPATITIKPSAQESSSTVLNRLSGRLGQSRPLISS